MARFRLRKRVVEAPAPDPFFPVPARFNFTRDVVEAAAAADGHRHAMTAVDREGIIDRRTFKEIAHDASRWTALFRSRGLKPGDRIVVLLGRTPQWHSVVLGALKGGFVAVPCPSAFDQDEMMQRSAHCDARAVVTDRARAPSSPPEGLLVVEHLRQELRSQPVTVRTHDTAADDPALILYTAGTTGAPKGAVHTHASLWTMRVQAENWLDAHPDDLVWCSANVGSTLFVWNSLIGPWSLGSEIVVHEGEFEVEERFDLIDRLGVTVLCQPSSEYLEMAEHAELETFYIGSVRRAVSTGAPLEPTVAHAFRIAFGLAIHDGYGQTETGLVIASRGGTGVDDGALGTPIPGYDIVVLDEDGYEQAADVEGEMALRGRPPSLFTGYWDDPEGTGAAFLGEWYLTGDRASRDANGFLTFAGRADEQLSTRLEARDRAAAAAAAEAAAVEEADREAEERARQADEERRQQEERAAAAAEAAAAAAAEAEADREAAERARQADEERRQQEAAATAEAISAESSARVADTASETASPVEPSAKAKHSRREAAAARRAEKAAAKVAEQERKAEEKRRREEEKAAAEQARRDEAEAKRAAEAKARWDEQQRALDEKRRLEEEKTAAEQARRDEAEAKRAAEAAAEEKRKREKDSRSRRSSTRTIPETEDATDANDQRISAELIARLRAYGHGDSSEDALKDQE